MLRKIGDYFLGKDLEYNYSDIDRSSVVALYFTAGWCPPCRAFNPVLIEFYNDVNYPDKRFEVIQISSDQDEVSFNEYFGGMPWVAIPFGDQRITDLKKSFNVQGIPLLLLINRKGEMVYGSARNDIQSEGPSCFERWLNQYYG